MNLSPLFKQAAREPLLHFLLLGALIFGVDHLLDAGRADPQTIVVGADVQKEARDIFAAGMQRQPSASDMKKLLDRWTDNEILYREGLALGLDRGDATIRERVIFKALSVAQAGITLPKIDEPGLRNWFEARHARYDAPARYSFLEAVVTSESTPEVLQSFVKALNADTKTDVQSDLRVFKDRPRGNLLESYGSDFAEALDKAPVGTWQAIPSTSGLRVVRLESSKPPIPASFDPIKEAVYQDWRDDTMAEMTSKAVREMGKKYAVRIEGEKP
ncbi:peptidyl-prolyl cis-trans isomerase [Variovorax terrae]|uniref:Peptidylprolyl isomerase n=1 Tax=Variovorax terrae TaxID=2923278 RepID=A0A9X1VXL1_9BURK|nr:peptidylprolyl isomerase [Variovorax terrae]MCJ0763979.1 peptidylprolyl isomerase [Variovorax terrae]